MPPVITVRDLVKTYRTPFRRKKVEALMEGGAIMMERAKVIRYSKS